MSKVLKGMHAPTINLFPGTCYIFCTAGPSTVADTPYAIPLPQPSEAPSNVSLAAVDGSTLRLKFDPPASTGGEEIDRYVRTFHCQCEYLSCRRRSYMINFCFKINEQLRYQATTLLMP